jgi:very-short-patch-repair endonuclease
MTTPVDGKPALDPKRPFTRADAIAAGISPKMLCGSRFRRVFRGVYVAAEVEVSPFVRTQAALALHPEGAFASHTSAAHVYKIPVPDVADVHVSVFEAKDRRARPGIVPHVVDPKTVVTNHRGIPVANLFTMFVQLASLLDLVDLVVAGDAMVRTFRVRPAQLVNACVESDDAHSDAAARAARLVREGVDSPMETRLRLLLVLAGLPEPEVNFKIRDADGEVLRRLDLCYPQQRLIVEYDGRQHVEVVAQWEGDLDRREEFDDTGWKILVVTAKGIYREPWRTLERVHRNLVERSHPELPRHLSDEWRIHFPGH